MPVEVLVMCGQCGRPQRAARPSCAFCGAPLPEALTSNVSAERDQLLEAYRPFVEADFGRGRSLTLSQRRLEWRSGPTATPSVFDLSDLASVQLDKRPVYESLIFAVFALSLVPFAGSVGQALLLAVCLLAVAACFLQWRYALVLRRTNGRRDQILLGFSRPRAPLGKRIDGIWASLSAELDGLGLSSAGKAT